MTAVSCTGLVKTFDEARAIDGVDLEVASGEVRGLLGPNGAGKTTLLRILFGLVHPDAGAVEVFGRRLYGEDEVVLDGVGGFVEEPTFYPYLSGRTNLELLAELDGGDAATRVDEVLETVALTAHGDARVGGYSTGMRQRLGIAAALLRKPRLLLLDEPAFGLDPAGMRDVRALLRSLAGSGIAILVSSHDIAEVEDACDSFTILRSGHIVWDGTSAELRAQAPPSVYRLVTNDDRRALAVARSQPQVRVRDCGGDGLAVDADEDVLDSYVLALAAAGVAVRRLELETSPLESIFFSLTADRPSQPVAS